MKTHTILEVEKVIWRLSSWLCFQIIVITIAEGAVSYKEEKNTLLVDVKDNLSKN